MEEITNTALALNGNHLEYFNDLTFEKFAECHEALSKANWTESLPDCAEHSNVVAYYEDTKPESIAVQFRLMPCQKDPVGVLRYDIFLNLGEAFGEPGTWGYQPY